MDRFLVILFTALCWLPLSGQPQDRYAIHFDKPFYATGEMIWLTVHPPLASPSPLPGIVRAVLYDPDGNELRRFHLRQSAARFATGYIKIPYDWQSGQYRLTLECSLYLEDGIAPLLDVLIPIYNDLEFNIEAEGIRPNDEALAYPTPESGSLRVDVQLEQQRYRPGSTIEAVLTVRDERGQPLPAHCSVSVTDRQLLLDEAGAAPVYQFSSNYQPTCTETESAMVFQGQVLDSSGLSLRTFSLSAYLPVLDTFLYTQTDPDGYFTLPLPDFYGETVIQFTDFMNEGIQIKRRSLTSPGPTEKLSYSRAVIDYLSFSRQRKKIYQLYGSIELAVEPRIPDPGQGRNNPDRLIRLSDYESFEDIPSLFRELLTPLKFRKEKGLPTARMYNPDQDRYYRIAPIFLMDGQLTTDAAYIAGLDIDRIQEIGLYYEASKLSAQFGRMGLGGVVVLKTKGDAVRMPPTAAPNRFTISGLQAPLSFPASQNREESEAPVFRPLVFWEGALETDSKGKAILKFRPTDDRSTFQIQVVAQSPDGKVGFGTGTYQVKP